MSKFICCQLLFMTLLVSRCTIGAPFLFNAIVGLQTKYDSCGQSFFLPTLEEPESKFERIKRMINGHTVVAHSWPWTVFLKYNGTFVCGGTLIDPFNKGYQSDTVLTAAHCLENKNYSFMDVTLGAHELTNNAETGRVTIGISEIRFHRDRTDRTKHDIAIIKLEKSVKFNQYIKPACLPMQNEQNPPKTSMECYATGWGLMSEQDKFVAQNLQQVKLSIHGVWLYDFIEVDTHPTFTAGSFDETKGICNGDSGSPLVCKNRGTWTLFGIAVANRLRFPSDWTFNDMHIGPCARENVTNVFVRTSHYITWIQEEAISLQNNMN